MPSKMPGISRKIILPATKVAGYVQTPIAKKCGTCEYFSKGLCKNSIVARDKQVPTDKDGMKMVDGENGCCNQWEAE